MPSYRLHNADCSISTQYLDVSHESQLPMPEDGFMWSEVPSPASEWTVAVDDEGALIAVPFVEPDEAYMMSLTRAKVWAEARAYREVRKRSGCMTPKGRVDADDRSLTLIGNAVQRAQLEGGEFTTDWTMSDNSVVTHNLAELIAMGLAVGDFVQACQDAGTLIRERIGAALSLEELSAIDIKAGYP